jgi:uncharacterized repeat protein (TIGR03806 family)
MIRAWTLLLAALAGCGAPPPLNAAAQRAAPDSLETRPVVKSYLRMPNEDTGHMPPLLSQTGAFKDAQHLLAGDGLIPYDLNFPFWSDGAAKSRWIAVPNDNSAPPNWIGFATNGEWKFPAGTVFVKHFELAIDETHPDLKRRLETRLLVRDRRGGVYGVTYKWRPDNTDADLLLTNLAETIRIKTAVGTRTQTWYYPSRKDCLTCHTECAGGVLGVKTRQLNRDFTFPSGTTDNQLRAWNRLGLFAPAINEADISKYPKLASPDDLTRSLEDRARSYLDANCSNCHRPGGTVGFFDTRYDTPLRQQGLVHGPVLFSQGIDRARIIAPNDPWRSIALLRVESIGGEKMPPLAHNVLDRRGADLLREWISSLDGTPVLPPPKIRPAGGRYAHAVEVTLGHQDPGVLIRYTLDGSVPTSADTAYTGPLEISSPATLRAKAFKAGFTRSITVQETFQIDE